MYTEPLAGKCLASFSITIIHPGLVIIGICNLGSGSLCQLKVERGSFNKIRTLPSLNFSDKIYKQFLGGKEIVFSNLLNNGVEIFSLDGILAKKITFEKWCKI